MKKVLYVIATLMLLFAFAECASKKKNNPNELTITGEAIDITTRSVTLTGYANLPLEYGDAQIGMMYADDKSFDNSRKIVAFNLDGNNMFTVSLTSLSPSTTYYYKSYVQNGMALKFGAIESFTTQGNMVDLGLSVDWGSSNLSESGFVSSPEEYGDYYAWGETTPQEKYAWKTYKWGHFDNLKKYNIGSDKGFVDNMMVLDPEDDAAHVKLGGKWRIPTESEWTELLTKCTWKWTTLSGVTGFMVTSKKNGNSIFLPAAGHQLRSDYTADSSRNCCYWSSSLDKNNPWAAGCFYYSLGKVDREVGYSERMWGYSVRPVSE